MVTTNPTGSHSARPNPEPGAIIVVAVALLDPAGRVLMQRRQVHKHHGGLWEFPGGKLEPGETPQAALVREVEEELGLAIDSTDLVPLGFAGDERIVLLLFACRAWRGLAECRDAERIGWFTGPEIAALARPPLDVELTKFVIEVL